MRRRDFLGLGALLGVTSLGLAKCAVDPRTTCGAAGDGTPDDGAREPGACADEGPARIPRNGTAIVIGSGFGGAISALRLGEAGVKTIVLERGRRWNVGSDHDTFCENMTPDGRAAWLATETNIPIAPLGQWPIDKYVGVLQRRDFDNISVYMGAGVGGSSLVYGGMTVIPEERLFKQAFPPEVDFAEMVATYYPRVLAMIGATPMPADIMATDYYRYARVFQAHAALASLPVGPVHQAADWDIIRKELNGSVPSSALSGQLIFGNNSGSKRSLDRTYIPAAEATGNVTVKPLHQVSAIGRDEGGGYRVEVERIDEQGNVVESLSMSCDYLFVCAGSIHTTELLLRARANGTLPDLNEEVGQGWGSNGNAMFMREGVGLATGDKQGSPPALALRDFDNPIAPTLAEVAQYPLGLENHALLHLACVVTPARGAFSYDPERDEMTLAWTPEHNTTARAAATDLADRLNVAAGTGSTKAIMVPDRECDLTYHPCGGAVLGKALDFHGRVKGYEHLYVLDGAMMPGTCAGANPSLTIAALVERNIERLIAEDDLS